MASGCLIPKLDTTRYSSPIPLIGLYIAAGSSVCFLLILFDIISAYRRSQWWIPCRFFKINSFTLTLLSISSKLQVDLTTPMPGAPDQLSKLTGTTFICICMGYLNSSVGNNGDWGYLSNMASLSIMIITVVVNICIQFYTGVVHLYIPEHIIMMCCMLIVLLLMWFCARETKLRNKLDIETTTSPMKKNGSASLAKRLVSCYVQGFDKNTQLRACRSRGNLLLMAFSLACFCVQLQAIVRFLVLKQLRFCLGGSDYDWSMWFILILQSLTIIVSCLALCFRWFTSFSYMDVGMDFKLYVDDDDSMAKKFISIFGTRYCYKLGIYFQTGLWIVSNYLLVMVLHPLRKLFRLFGGKFHFDEEFSSIVGGFVANLPRGDCHIYPCDCTVGEAIYGIERCIEESNASTMKELLELISRTSPSQQSSNIFKERNISPLAIATLMKIAISCLPNTLTEGLVTCFYQAVDILNIGMDSRDAEYEMFTRNPFSVNKKLNELHENVLKYDVKSPPPSSIIYARKVLNGMRYSFFDYRYVAQVIFDQKYDTVEDLYNVIEQLFVDMLHLSFNEIPNTIFKIATDSHMDEYIEKLEPSLVALLKIMPMEDQIKWSFPEKFGISCLF